MNTDNKLFTFFVVLVVLMLVGFTIFHMKTMTSFEKNIRINNYSFCKNLFSDKNCIECHKGENYLYLFSNPLIIDNAALRKDILNKTGIR